MRFLLRPWCWLNGHGEDERFRQYAGESWIQGPRCSRCHARLSRFTEFRLTMKAGETIELQS